MSGDGWNSMPGQPRICAGCGERILISKQAVWFKTSKPQTSWHSTCRKTKARLHDVRALV